MKAQNLLCLMTVFLAPHVIVVAASAQILQQRPNPIRVNPPREVKPVVIPPAEKVTLSNIEQPKTRQAIGTKERRSVNIRRDLLRLGVVYDARGTNLFFPLPTTPRRFNNPTAFAQTIQAETNGRIVQTRTGQPLVSTRSVQIGASYWVEPQSKLIYRVTDPLLAAIGGRTGKIFFENREICVDPDGNCSAGLPSYLTPVVRPTSAVSHVTPACIGSGDSSRCVQYHAFYNKVPLGFFNWARHGANTRMIQGSAAEINRLITCPADTPAPEANLPVEFLRATLRTGGDDLRESSHAMMTVTLAERPGLPPPPVVGDLPQVSLNEGRGLGNNSTFTSRSIALPRGTLLGHISKITIFHDSRQRNPFDTRDNWNMDAINVVANPGGANARNVLGETAPSNTTLHRFSGSAPAWSRDIVPGERAEICFQPVTSAIDLGVGSSLRKKLTDPEFGGTRFVDLVNLPDVSGIGVEMVETAAYFIGAGFQVQINPTFEPSSPAPGGAPEDQLVWAADGVCGRHRADGFESGLTGNGDHGC